MECMERMGRVMENITALRINMRLRAILPVLFMCTCLFSYAQNEGWQVYPAYTEAVQVEAAGNYLYCIMKGSGTINSNTGNLVRYDVEDGSVKTYDCLHELNDKEISRISYNEATGRLLVLYSTGNLDLLDADDNVVNISALSDASIYGERIKNISHIGKYVYLCLDFEIIEIDTELGVVGETYRIDAPVFSIQSLGNKIYVSRGDGLYQINDRTMMHVPNNWQKVDDGVFDVMQVFAGRLYALKKTRLCYLVPDESGLTITETSYYFKKIDAFSNYLLCTDAGSWIGLYSISSPQNPKIARQNYKWSDFTFISDILYVCDKEQGLIPYMFNEDDSAFSPISASPLFVVNSPRSDLFYHMNYVDERLLVAGGINTQMASYYPVTFMCMEENGMHPHWTLFDEIGPKEAYPHLTHYNAVDLVQDPTDANHFYGAVYRNGLHEYRMDENGEIKFVRLFNYENSPLKCIDVDTPVPWNYCTCTALQYDSKGNLWMANQQTDTIVRIMRPNGKWMSLYYPEIVKSENVFQYLFSSYGINFIVAYGGDKRGFFGFDTGGTLNLQDDDRHLLRKTITNQDGVTVTPNLFFCMSEDHDNQIWCGTNEGLFVITRPQDWFDSDFRFHQIKRNRNDGSGFADYLLSGVNITCIEVDPSNRKWIGTQSDGVYLVSHDGQETIHHFTKANSPLLSDYIYSIAVHPYDGRVMFGTDAGLCSYEENVTVPAEELTEESVLVYPNPVRPNTDAIVTICGLTDGSEVKILSSSGQVVCGTKSIGGSVRWNCCNMLGERVASGVYHIVCNTGDAKQTVVKRVVVLK